MQENPSLSRAHFQFIADVIHDHVWERDDEKVSFAEHMADELEHHNPRFDRSRFLDACGIIGDDDDETD